MRRKAHIICRRQASFLIRLSRISPHPSLLLEEKVAEAEQRSAKTDEVDIS